MDWKRIAPWNWFRKEEERGGRALAPARGGDPFRALHEEMERAFDEVARRFGGLGAGWPGPAAGEGATLLRPSLDIAESRKGYTVRVEVPGVEKGDVTLRVEDDTLLIRGEKRQEKDESEEGYHCVERSYGVFERVLSLPEDADPEGIDARFRNGVLTITIAKREASEPLGRSIEVRHE